MIVKVMRMEECSWCGGHGLRYSGESVIDCYQCGGGGVVEARDEKGRFLPWRVIEVPEVQLPDLPDDYDPGW